ncbi:MULTISPECIES: hypothetical protein [unclassified Nitratiruptor]|uniref:hypothetical protein n=1 Tax=unclassified Nitratiruptor TaxID=2624044 RepID=UPI001916A45E|nr:MULTISPECIES: hypothetical protein [unclassified Nitratiruptor]
MRTVKMLRGDMMEEKLKNLYREITKERGEPLDFWEVAALLEVYGMRDVDVKKEYGFEDVFTLAKELMCYKDIKKYPVKTIVNMQKLPPIKERVIQNYLKGLAFAIPMLIQILATIILGFALWSNIHIDESVATMIAFGTFLAMIFTGGPAQIIGRKGLYYLKMNEDVLAAKTIWVFYITSVIAIVILSLIFFLFNTIFQTLDSHLFIIFLSTFFLLSILFLNISIYYVFEEYGTIALFFVLGVVFVIPIHYILHIDFPYAQFVAIALLDLFILYFARRKLINLKSNVQSEGELLPRVSMLIYTLLPFFIYGVFYFLFLVLDKLIEWNTNALHHGFFIWFDVKYEIGTDLALIVLVLLIGLLEVVVYEFLYKTNENVFAFSLHEYEQFNGYFQKFYRNVNRIFIIFALGTIIVTSIFSAILVHFVSDERLPFSVDSAYVFVVSAVAYAFLTAGLMNALILFSFSRQKVVVKAIVLATVANFFVGVIFSNLLYRYFAVMGLLVGSAIFWYVTYSFLKTMFKKFDYYYYSAF